MSLDDGKGRFCSLPQCNARGNPCGVSLGFKRLATREERGLICKQEKPLAHNAAGATSSVGARLRRLLRVGIVLELGQRLLHQHEKPNCRLQITVLSLGIDCSD